MSLALQDEIRSLNLSYLMLAQQLLRSDREAGMLKLGVGEDVADILCDLSPSQILRMAASDMVLCQFRFDDALLLRVLAQQTAANPAAEQANKIHAMILAAGKPVSHLV